LGILVRLHHDFKAVRFHGCYHAVSARLLSV
jgi:hypothetical protein